MLASLSILLLLSVSVRADFPANEYMHSVNRDALLDAENRFEHRKGKLNWKEQTVDHYLQYLKWREFMATKKTGFPPSRPLEEMLSYIQTTEIYKALWKFPKGGNMHTHENHDVSKKVLLDIVWNSTDFKYLYMLPPKHPNSSWTLDFFVNPPTKEWINLKATKAYTKEEILKYQTFIGILSYNATRYPTDSGIRWKEMNALWRRATNLISNLPIKKKYIEAMYQIGLDQGVIYFETRKNIYDEIYVLDRSPHFNKTYGRRYLTPMDEEDAGLILKLSRNFAKKHPEFVGHKRIYTIQRRSSMEKFHFYMENVVRMHNLYPDHVIGFDAVGEEDAGYSQLHYISEWLKLYNSTGQLRVPLYLHTAETNWPDDLMTSDLQDDIASSLMNTYETILLSASRIGHGNGFIKHPYLLALLKEKQIPLEICVVSNQLLGFTPDIRNHPAQHFLRYGIPIVFGSDDAGSFGYDNFTVDWYEAFMAWGLDLQDLRTLAINSLNYSGLNEKEKTDAIKYKWKTMWNSYIATMYDVACSRDYASEATGEKRRTVVGGILPREGVKRGGSTNVHIFGLNFESAICKRVKCKFGDRVSPMTIYISNQHIVCKSPDFDDGLARTVDVSLALDGTNYVQTGFQFSYKHAAQRGIRQ